MLKDQGSTLKFGRSKPLVLSEFAANKDRPVYLYDLDDVAYRYSAFAKNFLSFPHQIHYAVKANTNAAILNELRELGAGADVVSGGELKACLAAGFEPSKIIFSGVGKTHQEIQLALSSKIKQINVESKSELERILFHGREQDQCVAVAFRYNPEVNPSTHPYITTGFKENKFGLDLESLKEMLELIKLNPRHLKLVGLTLHIGSQLLDLTALREAVEKTAQLFLNLQREIPTLESFDMGGGIGIHYETGDERQEWQLFDEYVKLAKNTASFLKVPLSFEPGRFLVARAGVLLGEIQYLKRTTHKNFVILNTGIHHLIRPALYQAFHRILALEKREGPMEVFDVVGPLCESSDTLGKARPFSGLREGDWLAIADAGAYGFVMASHYNFHDLPLQYALKNGKLSDIR